MATSNEQSTKNYFERFKKPIAAITLATLGAVGLSACGPSASADKVPPAATASATPGAGETPAPSQTETADPISIDKPSENTYSDPTEVQLSFNTPRNPNNLSYTTYPFNINGKEFTREAYVDRLKMPVDEYKDPKQVALAFINERMNTIFLSSSSEVDIKATENPSTHDILFMPSDEVGGGNVSAQHFFYAPAYGEALFNSDYRKGETDKYPHGINMLNASAEEFSRLYSMSMDDRSHSSAPYRMGVSASETDITNVNEAPISPDSPGYNVRVTANVHFEDNGDKTDTIVQRRASGNLPAKWAGSEEMTFTFMVRDGNWVVDDVTGLDFETAVAK
jgi:hypothetical protein